MYLIVILYYDFQRRVFWDNINRMGVKKSKTVNEISDRMAFDFYHYTSFYNKTMENNKNTSRF